MEGRSKNELAWAPTAAVAVGLVLALGGLAMRVAAAPSTLVANVVSHFVVHEGGSTFLKQPQVDVQCSAPPGLQCRTLIRNNQLIINVYQDDYRGESAQNFKESREDNTVVPFRWSSTKPDRMSRKSNIDTKHLREAEQTSTRHVFDPYDTQDESLEKTSHDEDRTHNTGDDFQVEIHDSSNTDDKSLKKT